MLCGKLTSCHASNNSERYAGYYNSNSEKIFINDTFHIIMYAEYYAINNILHLIIHVCRIVFIKIFSLFLRKHPVYT